MAILFLGAPIGCSSSKAVRKAGQQSSAGHSNLLTLGTQEVTKELGEPTTVSKTPEGHLLWVYEPKWKLIPNDKGTVYLEFKDGKVAKVFKIK